MYRQRSTIQHKANPRLTNKISLTQSTRGKGQNKTQQWVRTGLHSRRKMGWVILHCQVQVVKKAGVSEWKFTKHCSACSKQRLIKVHSNHHGEKVTGVWELYSGEKITLKKSSRLKSLSLTPPSFEKKRNLTKFLFVQTTEKKGIRKISNIFYDYYDRNAANSLQTEYTS